MWAFTGRDRPSFAITPKENQESVWDYPRPPVSKLDSRQVLVKLGNVIIAESTAAIRVLETAHPPTFYLPKSDVRMDYFVRESRSSFCEWKGQATYWTVKTEFDQVASACWSYPSPRDEFQNIQNCFSFYPAQFECTIDGETVRPQPGGFYGGWVTDEVIGPYKGDPGTSSW